MTCETCHNAETAYNNAYKQVDTTYDALRVRIAKLNTSDDNYHNTHNNHPNHLGHPMTCETCRNAEASYQRAFEAYSDALDAYNDANKASLIARDTYLTTLNDHPEHTWTATN